MMLSTFWMNHRWIIIATLVAGVITFALRALPFLIFGGKRQMPEMLVKLGQVLPPAMMAVLIVYCLKSTVTDWKNTGIANIAAVLMTGVSYKWKHQMFVSIVLGTAVYMILLRVI